MRFPLYGKTVACVCEVYCLVFCVVLIVVLIGV
jgi:hypothetical protein